jgi:hypothetical protein
MPALDLRSLLASPALARRQNNNDNGFVAIPSVYGQIDSSPHPAAVAGIVLGAVGGFLLLLFLLYSCLGFGPRIMPLEGSVLEVRSSRRSHSHKRRRRSGVRVRETVEVRTRERVPVPPAPPGDGPIIVDAPPPRVVSDDEDEVVVIEEHGTPPRRGGRRSSSRAGSEYYERRSRDY